MKSSDPTKRSLLSYEQFLKKSGQLKNKSHLKKGSHEVVDDSYTDGRTDKKGYITLSESNDNNIVMDHISYDLLRFLECDMRPNMQSWAGLEYIDRILDKGNVTSKELTKLKSYGFKDDVHMDKKDAMRDILDVLGVNKGESPSKKQLNKWVKDALDMEKLKDKVLDKDDFLTIIDYKTKGVNEDSYDNILLNQIRKFERYMDHECTDKDLCYQYEIESQEFLADYSNWFDMIKDDPNGVDEFFDKWFNKVEGFKLSESDHGIDDFEHMEKDGNIFNRSSLERYFDQLGVDSEQEKEELVKRMNRACVDVLKTTEAARNGIDVDLILEKKWSADVKEKWHPKEGIFTESAEKIAAYLKKESKDLRQAMSRLNFYMNRSGDKLKKEDKARLEDAKKKLHSLYKK